MKNRDISRLAPEGKEPKGPYSKSNYDNGYWRSSSDNWSIYGANNWSPNSDEGAGDINDIKLKPVTTGNKQDTGKYDRKMRRRRRVRIRREAYRAIED